MFEVSVEKLFIYYKQKKIGSIFTFFCYVFWYVYV